ncbi:MAG: GIY-YIG nuclease family protein, partial [Candidatus Omnitrophica bacterium]|nr:GIY-YIG nuclease family protein [Candidatus Omnitrophota bacterium]
LTSNVERRIIEHNKGDSLYTKKYMPWKLGTYVAFNDKLKAADFEKYLKSGSGFAFLKHRLI